MALWCSGRRRAIEGEVGAGHDIFRVLVLCAFARVLVCVCVRVVNDEPVLMNRRSRAYDELFGSGRAGLQLAKERALRGEVRWCTHWRLLRGRCRHTRTRLQQNPTHCSYASLPSDRFVGGCFWVSSRDIATQRKMTVHPPARPPIPRRFPNSGALLSTRSAMRILGCCAST